jgi:hypothetical protein
LKLLDILYTLAKEIEPTVVLTTDRYRRGGRHIVLPPDNLVVAWENKWGTMQNVVYLGTNVMHCVTLSDPEFPEKFKQSIKDMVEYINSVDKGPWIIGNVICRELIPRHGTYWFASAGKRASQ